MQKSMTKIIQAQQKVQTRQLKSNISNPHQDLLYLQTINNMIIKIYKDEIIILKHIKNVQSEEIYLNKQQFRCEIKRIFGQVLHNEQIRQVSIMKMYKHNDSIILLVNIDQQYAIMKLIDNENQISQLKNIFINEPALFPHQAQELKGLLKEEYLACRIDQNRLTIINYCKKQKKLKYYVVKYIKNVEIKVQMICKIQEPRLNVLFSHKNPNKFMLITSKNMLIYTYSEKQSQKQSKIKFDYQQQVIFKKTIEKNLHRKKYQLQLLYSYQSKNYLFFLFNKTNQLGNSILTVFIFQKNIDDDCKIKQLCQKDIKADAIDLKSLRVGLLTEDERVSEIWIRKQQQHYVLRIVDKKLVVYPFSVQSYSGGILARINDSILMINNTKKYEIRLPKIIIPEEVLKQSPSFSQKDFFKNSPQNQNDPNQQINKQIMPVVNSLRPNIFSQSLLNKKEINPLNILADHMFQRPNVKQLIIQKQLGKSQISFTNKIDSKNVTPFQFNPKDFKEPSVKDAQSQEQAPQTPKNQNKCLNNIQSIPFNKNVSNNIAQMENYQISSNKFQSFQSNNSEKENNQLFSPLFPQNSLIMNKLSANFHKILPSNQLQDDEYMLPASIQHTFSFGQPEAQLKEVKTIVFENQFTSQTIATTPIAKQVFAQKKLDKIPQQEELQQSRVDKIQSFQIQPTKYVQSKTKSPKLQLYLDLLQSVKELKNKTTKILQKSKRYSLQQTQQVLSIKKQNIFELLYKKTPFMFPNINFQYYHSEQQIDKIIKKDLILYYFDKKKPLRKKETTLSSQKKNQLQLINSKMIDYKQQLHEMRESLINDRIEVNELINEYKNLMLQKEKRQKEEKKKLMKKKQKKQQDVLFNIKYGKTLQFILKNDASPLIQLSFQ